MRIRIRPEWKLCAAAYAVIGAVALAGCVASPDTKPDAFDFVTVEARNKQLGLTALIGLDTAQTVTIGRSAECLYEANPVAAAVFGSATPSPQRVLISNAIYIGAHWLLGSFLDRKASAPIDLSISAEEDLARHKRWHTAQRVYQFATAIGHGGAVINNEARGIRPFSSYDCGGAR